MKNINLLAYKMKSFDTEVFIQETNSCVKNSVIVVFDFDKIIIERAPTSSGLTGKTFQFFKFKSNALNYNLSPIVISINFFRMAKIFFWLCRKYRPKMCWIENTYAALIFSMLKKIGLCSRLIYLPGDWVGDASYSGKWSAIVNKKIFPLMDLFACSSSDIVLDHTEKITAARYAYWGRKVSNNIKTYKFPLKVMASGKHSAENRCNICFIGQLRDDCGIELVIQTLKEIRKEIPAKLYIIGPKTKSFEKYLDLVKSAGVYDHVVFFGFLENSKIDEVVSSCFCGLNLLTVKDSYSSYTIPGKLLYYIQYLLPVIVSSGAGCFTDTIKEMDLGIVIKPENNEFISAAKATYNRYADFEAKIRKYLSAYGNNSIEEVLKAG